MNWNEWRSRLDVSDDVRHVEYAKFAAAVTADELRYVQNVGWFGWNGSYWAESGDTAAYRAIDSAASALLHHAAAEPADRSWALPAVAKMGVNFQRAAIVREMTHREEFASSLDDFDANRHLLNFQNGTVDLSSGELRPFDPADMLTHMTNVGYEPDASCPRWERFIAEIFPGQPELWRYYQTFLGYCMTGEVKEHILGLWFGHLGRNGKGTTIRAMEKAFGNDLVYDIDFSTFEGGRGNHGPHTETVAKLREARLVVAQEGSDGATMNTALLKNWTGGDRISARHLYGRTFSFDPKFTLVLATNHLPQFSAGGAALWARSKSVHFSQHFTGDKVDPELEKTIQGPELAGVAAWIVRGAVAYYAAGRLRDIEHVQQANQAHQDEVDPLKPLVGELFEYDDGGVVVRSTFNGLLRDWRQANGEDAAKFKPSFVKKMLDANGVKEERVMCGGKQQWCYTGIRLPEDRPSEEQRALDAAVADGSVIEGVFIGEYESA